MTARGPRAAAGECSRTEGYSSLPTQTGGLRRLPLFMIPAMLLPALAYMALLRAVARVNDVTGRHAVIGKAAVAKGIVSIIIYAVGVPAAFLHPALTFLAVLVVALMWAMPDRWTRRVGG